MTTPALAGPVNAPSVWPLLNQPSFVDYPPDVQSRAASLAVEVLWAMSGRRFGAAPVTVRPARRDYDAERINATDHRSGYLRGGFSTGFNAYVAYLAGSSGFLGLSCCNGSCEHQRICEISLPGPVARVLSVKLDGLVVDPSTYRVDDFTKLVKLGTLPSAVGCWPLVQDLSLSDDQVGTFSVSYVIGEDTPIGGQISAGLLALELAKAFSGKECGLPGRIRTVARQGVTAVLLDPQDFFSKNRTGLYEVDLWLRAVNPYAQVERSRVYSPDRVSSRRRTS